MTDKIEPTETGETGTVDPFQRDNPRAMLNLLPPVIQGTVLVSYRTHPELFHMSERILYKRLRGDQKTPCPTDNRLRLQFWQEYDIAQATGKKMNMERVVVGVCFHHQLYERYFKNPYKVAWILCMPTTYDTYLTEALQFGMEQLRDVLEMPHIAPNGKIDTKLLELKAKIVFALDARKNGGIVQRVEQKQMNLNISTSDKSMAQAALSGTMEDMEKRLKELERQERKLLKLKDESEKASLPDIEVTRPTIDVTKGEF